MPFIVRREEAPLLTRLKSEWGSIDFSIKHTKETSGYIKS